MTAKLKVISHRFWGMGDMTIAGTTTFTHHNGLCL